MLTAQAPRISVVVPTCNRQELLRHTLESLRLQSPPPGGSEVIVVNDGSTDGTAVLLNAMVTSWTGLRCVTQDRSGPAAARNTGIRMARGSVVAFIDDDCVARPDWLQTIETFCATKGCAAIAGRILAHSSSTFVGTYCGDAGLLETPRILDGQPSYFVAANAAFKKAVLEEIGGFDEEFVRPGGEEVELCHRLYQRGYAITYCPEMVVLHRYRDTFKELCQTYFRYGQGQAIAMIKSGGSPSLIRFGAEAVAILLNAAHLAFAYPRYRRKGFSRGKSLLYPLLDKARGLAFRVGAIHYLLRRTSAERPFTSRGLERMADPESHRGDRQT